MLMNNKKKKVLVTGGTGSIGGSLLEAFSAAGYSVYFQYSSNHQKAMHLQNLLGATAIQIDFTTQYTLPPISFDIIVNNTGINISDSLVHETDPLLWQQTLDINLTAPFNICRFYLPEMMQKKWGRIININSIYGLIGSEYNAPYNASKHGLSGLTKTLAKEYIPMGITCNEICPGAVDSELMNRIAVRVSHEEKTRPEDFLTNVAKKYPAGKLVNPSDISSLAVFLASEEALYINGTSIPVDGGLIC